MSEHPQFYSHMSVDLIDIMGSDDAIIDAARTSVRSSFRSRGGSEAAAARDAWVQKQIDSADHEVTEEQCRAWRDQAQKKDFGLINMLMRDRHGSPFEHAVIKVRVEAPIFVFREWHRHRIASYNEMSGRYVELPPRFYIPGDDRPLRQIGKPGAYTFEAGTEEQTSLTREEYMKSCIQAWESYQRMLNAGVAKEVARGVLPVTLYSQMYATMNLRSLMNFLSLRTKTKENSAVKSFPQHEISMAADKLEDIFFEHFPWTYVAFQDNGRIAP